MSAAQEAPSSIDASDAGPSRAATDEVTAASASVAIDEQKADTQDDADADSEEEMEIGSDQDDVPAPSVVDPISQPNNSSAAPSSVQSTPILVSVLSKPKSSMNTSGVSAKPRVRFLGDDEEEGLPSIEDDANKKKKPKVGGAVATTSMLSPAELIADTSAQSDVSNKAKNKTKAQREAQSLAEQQAQQQQQALLQAIAPPPIPSSHPQQQQQYQQQQQAAFYQQQQAYQQQQFQQQQVQLTPEERITHARERIEKEPRDGDAWLNLLQLLQSKEEQDLDEIKKTYEDMLKIFPYAVSCQPVRSSAAQLSFARADKCSDLLPGQTVDRIHRLPPCPVRLPRGRSALFSLSPLDTIIRSLAVLPLLHATCQPLTSLDR